METNKTRYYNSRYWAKCHQLSRDWYANMPIDESRIARDNEEITSGICVYSKEYCPDAPGIYKVCNGKRTRISNDFNDPFNFMTLQVFLDQFRDAKKPLPDVDPKKLFAFWLRNTKSKKDSKQVFRKLMQIMIRPLNTRDDLFSSLRLVEAVLGKKIVYGNSLPLNNWGDGYEGVDEESPGVYMIMNYQRGVGYDTGIRFYDVRHLYEYVLNEHCKIVC